MAKTVLAPLSATGSTCVFSTARTHVVIDLEGHAPPGSSYRARRALTLFNTESAGGPRPAGSTTAIAVLGDGPLPHQGKAVALSITAGHAARPGWLTVYPCDQPRPPTSDLNYAVHDTWSNTVLTDLSSTGTVCIYTSAMVDLRVDLQGVDTLRSTYSPAPATRILDTRTQAWLCPRAPSPRSR